MKYANIKTGEITDSLPTQVGSTWNPTMVQLAEYGWRVIESVEQPQEGFRVVKRSIVNLTATTCKLIIAEQVNIAEEQAAQAAAAAAAEAEYKAWQADTDNWQKELRFVLTILKPVLKPAMTAAEYKAWLKTEWGKMT